MSAASLILGPSGQHLDHLAPLCALLNIPLVITDHQIEEEAKIFYPQVVTETFTSLMAPAELLRRYEIVISCHNKELISRTFTMQEKLQGKKLFSIWCPHGNSDKGRSVPLMEALSGEDVVLHYGKKMLDFIHEKKAHRKNCNYIPIGNYRLAYYESMKPFYTKLLKEKMVRYLDKRKTTLLYAPTWNDAEKSSSFTHLLPKLANSLPDDVQLIVKIHPNELLRLDTEVIKLIFSYEDQKGIFFLKHFPPIYPLLDFVDAYIGDMSSIGYDFLFFNKPMFFAKQENLALQECGSLFADASTFYAKLRGPLSKDREEFGDKRQKMYNYVFEPAMSAHLLWKAIQSAHEKWKNQTI